MDTNIKHLIGGGVLALLLTACGGGSSGGGDVSGNSPTPSTRDLPEEMAAVVDESNAFTEEFCPETSEGAAGTPLDPALCVEESEESEGGAPEPTDVVAQFCPTAASSFDLEGAFDPAAFTEGFDDPAGFLTDGPLSFPIACLQESATNLDGLQELIGGSNPITEQLCPVAATEPSFDPATCFAEVTGGANGGLPGLPGGGEGGGSVPGADQFLNQFCPESAGAGVGPETPLNCLNEASRVYITIVDMITNPNPLTDAVCPLEAGTGRVDPVVCFEEAVSGGGMPGLPGLGDLPGLPGGGDGGDGGTPDVPGLDQLTDALSGICPETLEAEVGPTTPIDCLAEAGGSFGGFEDLLGGLGGSNPLTEALCPTAATAESFDPAACFTEAAGQLPSAPGGGSPQIPGAGMALEQICPVAAGEEIGPTTPFDCLLELGGGFGDLEGLLGGLADGGLEGGNPLTDALCPVTSEEGLDPAACFMEALEGLPGGVPLPGGDGGNPLPGGEQLLGQLCPEAGAGEIGPTTPIECLTEAGQNLGNIQDMLGGLGGSNPLTEAVCPTASAAEQLDPAACLSEALGGGLPGLPGGGDGGVPEIPGVSDGLAQLCPAAGAGELGPTTPLECLTEAGQNLGGLTDLLGGLGGSNPLTDALCPAASGAAQLDPAACFTEALGNLPGAPGGDGGTGGIPEIPGLSDGLAQICPLALEGEVGPTTPLDCLMEAGGSLSQLQDLLGGLGGGLGGGEGGEGTGDPVTGELCPEAGAGGLSPTLPIECLLEAGQNLPDLLTGLLGGFGDLAP